MKNSYVLKGLFLTFAILFSSFIVSAQETPQIPSQYYGKVTSYDHAVIGKIVVVKNLNGNQVSVNVQSSDSEGVYLIHVKWDDSQTPEKEGVTEGERVIVYIDNKELKRINIDRQGGSYEMDLDISGQGIDPSKPSVISSPDDAPQTLENDNSAQITSFVILYNQTEEQKNDDDVAGDGSEQEEDVSAVSTINVVKKTNNMQTEPKPESSNKTTIMWVVVAIIVLLAGFFIFKKIYK
ncbi:MAG: hypothetical protein KKF95_07735 [Nanoarchaeota archaeon]|nr:hypothetical protein [Nanoarchaeota archaeon]